ncbi:MAG TPA: hypothetical protein VNB59_03540, partial [Solirubrobacterales bacterium]|nr:hypothetical protein [Solirubrobacterales bacterium]
MTIRKLLLALSLVLVAVSLPVGGATAANPPGGPVQSAKVTITLAKSFRRMLGQEGKVVCRGGCKSSGRKIVLQGREGMLEQTYGSGWIFLRGRLRFSAGPHAVTLRKLVFSTAKRQLTATVDGRRVVLAQLDEAMPIPTTYGVSVDVPALRLTPKSAKVLNRDLRLGRTLTDGDSLGSGLMAADLASVQLGPGTLSFSFEEGFRKKVEELGVRVVPNEVGTQTTSAPLGFSWSPSSLGSISRGLLHGGVSAGEG